MRRRQVHLVPARGRTRVRARGRPCAGAARRHRRRGSRRPDRPRRRSRPRPGSRSQDRDRCIHREPGGGDDSEPRHADGTQRTPRASSRAAAWPSWWAIMVRLASSVPGRLEVPPMNGLARTVTRPARAEVPGAEREPDRDVARCGFAQLARRHLQRGPGLAWPAARCADRGGRGLPRRDSGGQDCRAHRHHRPSRPERARNLAAFRTGAR